MCNFSTDFLYWKLCNWKQDYDSCSTANEGIFKQYYLQIMYNLYCHSALKDIIEDTK